MGFAVLVFLALFMSTYPDLDKLQWHKRVILIFASDESNPQVKQQSDDLESHAAGVGDRGIEIFRLLGHTAEAEKLRARLHLKPSPFAVVLVGKDGRVKLEKSQPVRAENLFATIDGMPMRRDEIRQKTASPDSKLRD